MRPPRLPGHAHRPWRRPGRVPSLLTQRTGRRICGTCASCPRRQPWLLLCSYDASGNLGACPEAERGGAGRGAVRRGALRCLLPPCPGLRRLVAPRGLARPIAMHPRWDMAMGTCRRAQEPPRASPQLPSAGLQLGRGRGRLCRIEPAPTWRRAIIPAVQHRLCNEGSTARPTAPPPLPPRSRCLASASSCRHQGSWKKASVSLALIKDLRRQRTAMQCSRGKE